MSDLYVAIVGSRPRFLPKEAEAIVRRYVRRLPKWATVVSGAADGVDSWAADEARQRGLKLIEYPVDKTGLPTEPKARRIEFAKRAHARNQKIVDTSDILVAVWDGKSPGTENTLERAKKAQIPHAVLTPGPAPGTFRFKSTDDPVNFYLEPREGH